jgi:hypothetical protein
MIVLQIADFPAHWNIASQQVSIKSHWPVPSVEYHTIYVSPPNTSDDTLASLSVQQSSVVLQWGAGCDGSQ